MITITAHTEPVVPIPVSSSQPVKEPQQIHELEENEKQAESGSQNSFAEILAGLINGKVTTADSSETEASEENLLEHFNMLTGNKRGTDIDLCEAGLLENIEIIRDMDIDFNGQTDFTDQMIAGAFEDAAQTDFSVSVEDAAFMSGEFSQDELALKTDKASLIKGNEAADKSELAARTASAEKRTEEALAAEIAANKKRVSEEKISDDKPKTEKTSEDKQAMISSLKNAGKENKQSGSEFAHNKREERSSEGGGRLDEMRKLSRRERIAFEVRDQRTTSDAPQSRTFMMTEASATRVNDASVSEMTLELRLPDFNAGQSSQTTWEVKSATAMENMLARELHQNLNGDIVRHASVALRDGGESVIRLALRPESLGNVKIRLEMTDNKITGVILVESDEAMNAFRKELAALEQAFKESGFADANLELSLSYDGKNQWQQQEENSFATGMAALVYEDSLRNSADMEFEAQTDVFGRITNGERSGYVNMLA